MMHFVVMLMLFSCSFFSFASQKIPRPNSPIGQPSKKAKGFVTVKKGSGLLRKKCLIGGDGGFIKIIPDFGCREYRDLRLVKQQIGKCEVTRNRNGDLKVLIFSKNKKAKISSYIIPKFDENKDNRFNYTTRESYGTWDTGIKISLGGWIGGNLEYVYSDLVTEIYAETDDDQSLKVLTYKRTTDPSLLPGGTLLGKSVDNFTCEF